MYVYSYLSIYLSCYLSVFLFIYIYLCIYLSIYLFIYLSIYLSIYLYIIYLSIYPSIHPSIYMLFSLFPLFRSYLPLYISICTCIQIVFSKIIYSYLAKTLLSLASLLLALLRLSDLYFLVSCFITLSSTESYHIVPSSRILSSIVLPICFYFIFLSLPLSLYLNSLESISIYIYIAVAPIQVWIVQWWLIPMDRSRSPVFVYGSAF